MTDASSRVGMSDDVPSKPAGDLANSRSVSRECGWCDKVVRERKDGRLVVHEWPVGWDRERDKPIMGRCVGSGTTEADLERAKS